VTLFFGAQRSRGMAQPGEKTAASASAGRCGHQAAGRLASIMRGSVGSAANEGDRYGNEDTATLRRLNTMTVEWALPRAGRIGQD